MKDDRFDDFPPIGGIMASKMVAEHNRKILFMYRDKPTRDEDSGWRIFSGYEDQEYNDNPGNTGIYSAATILKIDPSIADLLLHPVGSVFERENENARWETVDDFEFEDDYLVKQSLTNRWSITVSNLFVRRKDDNGDLVFVMKGKTIRVTIFHHKGKSREQLYSLHQQIQNKRNEQEAPTLETFDISEGNISKPGYMISESDGPKKYKVIYGSSIVDETILLAAFYFDKDTDKEWALNTWKTINYS